VITNAKIEHYTEYIDLIVNAAAEVYSMSCLPRVTVNKETGEAVAMENIWIDESAKKVYDEAMEHADELIALRDAEFDRANNA